MSHMQPQAWGVFEGGDDKNIGGLHDMFFLKNEAERMAYLKGGDAKVFPLVAPPEGYAIVPREPTGEMQAAGVVSLSDEYNRGVDMAGIRLAWQAMIAASEAK